MMRRRSLPPKSILDPTAFRDSKCVITDLQMPGMNGVDLRDRLIADGYRNDHFHERAARGTGPFLRKGCRSVWLHEKAL
jgi:hypothetical protein